MGIYLFFFSVFGVFCGNVGLFLSGNLSLQVFACILGDFWLVFVLWGEFGLDWLGLVGFC